jgi:hypothetical protein
VTRIATFQACDQVMDAGLGKLAFIGLYAADMIVPALPFTMPQMFFVVRFRTGIDDKPTKFAIRIERPGHEPFRIDNTPLLSQSVAKTEDAKFNQIQTVVRIAPFETTEEGVIRIFVEDENGDHYAGGLRINIGVHPETVLPTVANTANLVVGHYERFASADDGTKRELAFQLMEAFVASLKHNRALIGLQFPNLDMRLVLDNEHVKVFFPVINEFKKNDLVIAGGGNFETGRVESADQLGCLVKFEPSAPADAAFVLAPVPPRARKQEARNRSKNTKGSHPRK